MMNAIGIVEVAALAASAADSPPVVTRTLTGLRTRSEASPASRSCSPSAQRYSIVAFWPSTKPASRRPRRNASTKCQVSSGDLALRYPITGVCGCWGQRAANARPERLDGLIAELKAANVDVIVTFGRRPRTCQSSLPVPGDPVATGLVDGLA